MITKKLLLNISLFTLLAGLLTGCAPKIAWNFGIPYIGSYSVVGQSFTHSWYLMDISLIGWSLIVGATGAFILLVSVAGNKNIY